MSFNSSNEGPSPIISARVLPAMKMPRMSRQLINQASKSSSLSSQNMTPKQKPNARPLGPNEKPSDASSH
jgi:hypothetical protein